MAETLGGADLSKFPLSVTIGYVLTYFFVINSVLAVAGEDMRFAWMALGVAIVVGVLTCARAWYYATYQHRGAEEVDA